MYAVILATLPLFADASPPPMARAGCQGVTATSHVAAGGCVGTVARRAPLATVRANHVNRVASRQAARASRARVSVYRAAVVRAPAVAVMRPRVYLVKP